MAITDKGRNKCKKVGECAPSSSLPLSSTITFAGHESCNRTLARDIFCFVAMYLHPIASFEMTVYNNFGHENDSDHSAIRSFFLPYRESTTSTNHVIYRHQPCVIMANISSLSTRHQALQALDDLGAARSRRRVSGQHPANQVAKAGGVLVSTWAAATSWERKLSVQNRQLQDPFPVTR